MSALFKWFQSARQIWVWLNRSRSRCRNCCRRVSICQADLGLAEPRAGFLLQMRFPRVSICQADLGLAERLFQVVYIVQVLVSICQADLGLAELEHHCGRVRRLLLFQSARQIWVWLNLEHEEAMRLVQIVSICQADLGLAEPLAQRRFPANAHSFNLPGRFGFG